MNASREGRCDGDQETNGEDVSDEYPALQIAASTYPQQLSAIDEDSCVVFSGRELFHMRTPTSFASKGESDGSMDMICSSMMRLEENIEGMDAARRVDGSLLIACATGRGRVYVGQAAPTSPCTIKHKQLSNALDCPTHYAENGWHGVFFDRVDRSALASIHENSRRVSLLDLKSGKRVMSSRTSFWPTSACWGDSSGSCASSIIVTANDHVHVLDTRSKTGFATTRRQPRRGDTLNCVASRGNSIVTGGHQGMVYIYDTRKLTSKGTWNAPVKCSVLSLLISPRGDFTTYAVGADYELMCSGPRVGSSKCKQSPSYASQLRLSHSTGLRASSRWFGASLVDNGRPGESDTLLCVCEGGQFYRIRNAQLLAPGSPFKRKGDE